MLLRARPESTRWLCISAVVFAISLFTKQELVSFPGAVAIHLLLTSRKRFAIWLGTAAVGCAILLALTLGVDGRYFFDHLMMPRAYYVSDLWGSLGSYLYFVQVGFVVALIWACRATNIASTGFLLWGFLIAHVAGAFYCGGAGTGVNHFFDAMILTAIIAGLAPGLQQAAEGRDSTRRVDLRADRAVLSDIDGGADARLPADLGHNQTRPHRPRPIRRRQQFSRTQPGPALCEILLLCYAAGKPVAYDPFAADQLIRTGKISQEQLAELIARRQFTAIEIDWNANEPMQPAPRLRFPGPVMRALFSGYQLALRSGKYAVFTPRP